MLEKTRARASRSASINIKLTQSAGPALAATTFSPRGPGLARAWHTSFRSSITSCVTEPGAESKLSSSIKATSNVPRLVIQAVEAKSEDLARQILSAWFSGYALAEGREQGGNTLLIRNVLNVWGSMESALQTRFAALALHEECPIDETDFFWDTPGMTYLEAAERLIRKRTPKWLIGFRNITNATNDRTSIFTALPLAGVGNSAPLLGLRGRGPADLLYANVCSFMFDYIVRQKAGGTNLNFFIVQQFPAFRPEFYSIEQVSLIRMRVLELAYTDWSMKPFAQESGYDGAPFKWDDGRRFLLRCELDALYFHLYGIAREDVDYIMDTFPITRRKEEQQFGEYRTKRVILEIYDAMAEAERTGVPYASVIGHGDNWEKHFKETFGSTRTDVRAKLSGVAEIRNHLFHFRREISGEEFEELTLVRDWLLRRSKMIQNKQPRAKLEVA